MIVADTAVALERFARHREALAASYIDLDVQPFAALNRRQAGVLERVLTRYYYGEKLVADSLGRFIERWSYNRARATDRELMVEVQKNQEADVAFFEKYLRTVVGTRSTLDINDRYSKPLRLFFDRYVRRDAAALMSDPSWESEANALISIFLVSKGMIAEMGMYGLQKALEPGSDDSLLPCLTSGIREIRKQHRNDTTYAIWALNRTIVEQTRIEILAGLTARMKILGRTFDAFMSARKTAGMVVDEYTLHGERFPFEIDKGELRRHTLGAFYGIMRNLAVLPREWRSRETPQDLSAYANRR